MSRRPDDAAGRGTEPIPTGAFPFPLTGGPTESPYLTWLRNRSNYMATRGLLDYLRAVGVLVRGVVVNFLIFLPSLLLVCVALAYSHHWMLAHPYYLTMAGLSLGALWIVAFAVMTPIFAVARYKRSVDTGSETSIAQRDRYERSFGVFVLALVALVALESLPWALEYLHDMIELREFRWASGFATLAAGVALFSGADKLLSLLGGLKKAVAMALIGVVGLLVPLVVVLYTTDFLVYGLPPSPAVMLSPLAVPAVGVVAILVALMIGYKRGAFTGKESLAVGGMLVAADGAPRRRGGGCLGGEGRTRGRPRHARRAAPTSQGGRLQPRCTPQQAGHRGGRSHRSSTHLPPRTGEPTPRRPR